MCIEICTGKAIGKDGSFDREKCVMCEKCAEYCPVSARVIYGEEWEAQALADKVLCDREFFENSGGGVTLSGGECHAVHYLVGGVMTPPTR